MAVVSCGEQALGIAARILAEFAAAQTRISIIDDFLWVGFRECD
jgi:hypothetical protein